MSSALERFVSFLQFFWHLNYHILMFFLAYIGLYRTPVGLHGQEPYLGPAHLWLWRNMDVWDKVIALKWGGITNAHLKFSVSYKKKFSNIQLLESKKILRKFMIFFFGSKLHNSKNHDRVNFCSKWPNNFF